MRHGRQQHQHQRQLGHRLIVPGQLRAGQSRCERPSAQEPTPPLDIRAVYPVRESHSGALFLPLAGRCTKTPQALMRVRDRALSVLAMLAMLGASACQAATPPAVPTTAVEPAATEAPPRTTTAPTQPTAVPETSPTTPPTAPKPTAPVAPPTPKPAPTTLPTLPTSVLGTLPSDQ